MVFMKARPKLGELLIKNKMITPEQLELALKEKEKTYEFLGETLLRLNFIAQESMYLPFLAQQCGMEYSNLKNIQPSPQAIQKIPVKFAYYYKAMPLAYENGTLSVALKNPMDIRVLDGVRQIAQGPLKIVLASEKDILEGIRKFYGVGADTIDKIMDTVDVSRRPATAVSYIEEASSEATIGKLVNQILLQAYQEGATDIHIEPFEEKLMVRYRLDGLLHEAQVSSDINLKKA